MLRHLDRDRVAVIAALLAPLALAAVLVPTRSHVSNTEVARVLVVAVSALGNRLAGALAALSAAVWYDFFFTTPYQTFSITKSADIRTAVLLLLVGLAVSKWSPSPTPVTWDSSTRQRRSPNAAIPPLSWTTSPASWSTFSNCAAAASNTGS
ncbi:DUF4118 domain-containing protein [Kitasatospora sp. NPDC101235]|uniref:DUF4118 domain-containing protein n=1 Tax=Kitasatospora sp. NPDC101235 TaxID=3364101 RepID=UPI003828F35E